MDRKRDIWALAASLKGLAEQGFPVDLSVAIPKNNRGDMGIEPVGDPTVFVLPDGLTAYVLDVILINQTANTIYLRGLELRVCWENCGLELVPELKDTGKNHQSCFPRSGDPRPSASQSNRGLMNYGTLTRRPLQGRLFAVGGPLPKDLQHGTTCETTVAVSDMARLEHHGTVGFFIDRLTLGSKIPTQKPHYNAATVAGNRNSPKPSRSNSQPSGGLGSLGTSEKTA